MRQTPLCTRLCLDRWHHRRPLALQPAQRRTRGPYFGGSGAPRRPCPDGREERTVRFFSAGVEYVVFFLLVSFLIDVIDACVYQPAPSLSSTSTLRSGLLLKFTENVPTRLVLVLSFVGVCSFFFRTRSSRKSTMRATNSPPNTRCPGLLPRNSRKET